MKQEQSHGVDSLMRSGSRLRMAGKEWEEQTDDAEQQREQRRDFVGMYRS